MTCQYVHDISSDKYLQMTYICLCDSLYKSHVNVYMTCPFTSMCKWYTYVPETVCRSDMSIPIHDMSSDKYLTSAKNMFCNRHLCVCTSYKRRSWIGNSSKVVEVFIIQILLVHQDNDGGCLLLTTTNKQLKKYAILMSVVIFHLPN